MAHRVIATLEGNTMALGVGLVLAAIGAVIAFAYNPGTTPTYGIDVHTVGIILLVAGLAGVLLSLILWSTWAGPGFFTRSRRSTYVDDGGRRVSRREIVEDM